MEQFAFLYLILRIGWGVLGLVAAVGVAVYYWPKVKTMTGQALTQLYFSTGLGFLTLAWMVYTALMFKMHQLPLESWVLFVVLWGASFLCLPAAFGVIVENSMKQQEAVNISL